MSIDARDKITAGHSTRVRMYSTLLAKEIGMDSKDVALLEKAAILHDIGKIFQGPAQLVHFLIADLA